MRTLRRTALLALTVLVSACAPTAKPVSEPPGLQETLLERLEQAGGKYSSLKGIARVKVEDPRKNISTTQILLAQQPARLRSEILTPFGTPAMLLATDGDELTVYVPGDGLFYRGEASETNIRRLLRIPMRLEDLVDILLYDLPVFEYRTADARVESGSRFLLALDGEGGTRQEILFDRDLKLIGARYLTEEDILLEVDYAFGSARSDFPQKITVRMPQHESIVAVDFSDVANNVDIPADRFLLSPPAGVEVRPIPVKR